MRKIAGRGFLSFFRILFCKTTSEMHYRGI